MAKYNNNYYFNTNQIIKSSLEYYDKHQSKVNNFINEIEYVKFKDNNNLTDQIIFYNKKKEVILESSYELLSFFISDIKIWKWSWAVPTVPKKHTFITRKILDYSFDLDHEKDYLLKSTFLSSNIKITNDIQLDIHLALSAKICKKPFILKWFFEPHDIDNLTDSSIFYNKEDKLFNYKKMLENFNQDKNILLYLIILDYEIDGHEYSDNNQDSSN